MHRASLLLVTVLLLALAPTASSTRVLHASEVQGVTRAVHEYRLSSTVDEEVRQVLVRPGDVVESGDPLVVLRDDEARLGVELLELRATSTLRVDAAKAALDVSALEERESRIAMEDDAIRAPEMRRIELRAERDRLSYQLAIQEQREIELQLARARAALERYTLRAPASGIVTVVNVNAGELPERGIPVVEIVDTSRLRIELGVPAALASGLEAGASASVIVDSPAGDVVRQGRVTFISPLVEIGAGTRGDKGLRAVHVEFENTSGLPAGGLARVRFGG